MYSRELFGAKRKSAWLRRGRVNFHPRKVLIVLNFREKRLEAIMREGFELVCVVLPQGATREAFIFVEMKRTKHSLK